MQNCDPSDDDPFILTQKSLALSDGTTLPRQARSKFGRMIPFELWGYKLNVGPDYTFFICAFSILSLLGGLLIGAQIHFKANPLFILTSVSINLVEIVSYILIFVSNPGIARESVDPTSTPKGRYCQECEIYVERTTVHCQDCRVCILGYDHHCPWTSKCIGKGNLKRFYFFVSSIFVCLLYNVIVLPICLSPDFQSIGQQ